MNNLKQKILKSLRQRITDSQETISMGNCQNMHDYGKQCGRLIGFIEAEEIFTEIWEDYFKTNNIDDDEEFI